MAGKIVELRAALLVSGAVRLIYPGTQRKALIRAMPSIKRRNPLKKCIWRGIDFTSSFWFFFFLFSYYINKIRYFLAFQGQCYVNKATARSSVRQFTVLYTENKKNRKTPHFPCTTIFMHGGQIFNQLRSLRSHH